MSRHSNEFKAGEEQQRLLNVTRSTHGNRKRCTDIKRLDTARKHVPKTKEKYDTQRKTAGKFRSSKQADYRKRFLKNIEA